ncbi:MAG: sugar ABC transporter substrate-binding protein [Gaiellaceae bacterium]
MKKKLAVTGALVLAVSITAAVWTTVGTAQPQAKYKIGVSYQGVRVPFIKALQNAARAEAKKLGNVQLLEVDSNFDTNQELSNVQTLLGRGIQCLAIEAVSVTGSNGAVQAANAKKVPVIEFNSGTKGPGKYVAFVGANHYDSGVLLAKFVERVYTQTHKAKLSGLYLRGVAGQVTDTIRSTAVHATWKKDGYASKISTSEQHADFDRAKAQQVTESVISSGKPLDFIITNGDDMTLGAVEALKAHKLTGKVPIAGVDGPPEVLTDIQKGLITATVFQNPEPQGAGGVSECVQVLQGKKVPKIKYIPFVLTDKSNVNSMMAIAKRVYPH